jgi:acetyl-CoA synthetase
MSEEKIESILNETRRFNPPKDFVSRAQLTKEKLTTLHAQALKNYEEFWSDLGREEIDWFEPFNKTLDESQAPNYKWFIDGKLNASYNCLDVHIDSNAEKTAIIFEGEKGEIRRLSYADLLNEVCLFANGL